MIADQKDSVFLFAGDFIFFTIALWLSLALRHLEFPTGEIFLKNLVPFLPIFLLWGIVFLILDLYNRKAILFGKELVGAVLKAQLVNSLIALVFFYLFPFFGISPRAILLLHLVLSVILILGWRFYVSRKINIGEKEKAVLVGSGTEMFSLRKELKENKNFNIEVVNDDEILSFDSQKIVKAVEANDAEVVIIDLSDPRVSTTAGDLYQILFTRVRFVDLGEVYEQVFGRVSLSLVNERWFLENISYHKKRAYTILKRIMDIIVASVLFILSLIIYPFVFVAIKIQDRGRVFIKHKRVGFMNEPVWLVKFRSMRFDDGGNEELAKQNYVTKLGEFMRKTRIDEIPQLWNVLKGDISLVGPRPEFPDYVAKYRQAIPYYDVRHTIKPGLSGWAQIYHENHPHHGSNDEATKEKLSYDLFYVKNRGFLLDLTIALKTIRTLVSRKGA